MTTLEVLGTCHHDCPDSCGWIATSVDGVLTSVKGNPAHPFSQGELCPKVNKFVSRVMSDERLLHPLIRTGPKGSGEYRQATWDEALQMVVDSFTRVGNDHGGEAILPWWSAGTQGLIQNAGTSHGLFAKMGASRQTGTVCGLASALGMTSVYGAGLGTDPMQAEHSDHIILWGTNTRLTNRHLWPTIEAAQKRGAKVTVVDPIRTITADKADQLIQPLPGTDVALLLAIIHVLIADDLIDHEYVRAHAVGYDELASHVRTNTPDWAAPLTGLSADTIAALARDIGTTKATMLRALIGAEHHHSGGTIYRLLSMIPVLTGSHQVQGGGFARSVGAWSEVSDVDSGAVACLAGQLVHDEAARRSFAQPRLGHTLTELDDPIRALFIWNGNPVLTMPDAAAIRRGLERSDLFTVVSEQFMTDTARYADVVLPAAMETEQLDVVPAWGHLWLGWNEPATEPLGEAVSNTELFRRLAASFGFDDPQLHLSDREQIQMGVGDHIDLGELRRSGFVRITNYPEGHLPYANGGFATATGKAELATDSIDLPGLTRLPEWVPVAEGAGSSADFPLSLQTPKKATRFLNTSYSDLSHHADRETRPHIELDEADAAPRGLKAGDMARVFNHRGSLELPVAISDRLRPGVACVPWGHVEAAYGDTIGSVNDLTNAADTDLSGGSSYGDTMVQVEALNPCS